jgi:uncharacterized protein (TIGR02266 family)
MATKASDEMEGGDLSAFANRRADERVAARFEVRFAQIQDAARALRAYSLNISTGGLCLRTRKAYDVGSQVLVSMAIEGKQFHLNGLIAWVRDEAEAIFTGMSDEDRARLQGVVDSFRR